MKRFFDRGPARRLPSAVRQKLIAIPEREALGRAFSPPRRSLPSGVRARLLAIPSEAPAGVRSSRVLGLAARPVSRRVSRFLSRLLVDGRLAIAASAILAVLVAPLVEASIPASSATASAAATVVERQWQRLEADTAQLATTGLEQLGAMPGELQIQVRPVWRAVVVELETTYQVIVENLRPPLAALLGSDVPPPTDSQPPGASHVEPTS